tara:strand:- start:798 stop:1046 length:249 start_codon:yes stop_codon:yes gene_type:complete
MNKFYRLSGIDTAMEMLRPQATYEIHNGRIVRWEDDRPEPTIKEIKEAQKKAKEFENSINTIYTNEQIKKLKDKLPITEMLS